MTINTALQVTDFNFYGDNLMALRDSANGEIYTSITQILRNIGFTEKQNEYQKKKFMNDSVISKGTRKFWGVDLGLPSVNEVICISNRKLPIALTKITITPKMKQTQPELASKLELYQDKCADVLASVFIDHKQSDINMAPFVESITSLSMQITRLTEEMTKLKDSQDKLKPSPANKYSRWKTNIFNKIKLIQSYVNDNSDQELSLAQTMKLIFDELQDTYDLDLSEYTEMYKCEYGLDFDTKVQTLDVIKHYNDIRDMFTLTLDSILEKLHIKENDETKFHKNIFDELAAKMESKRRSTY